MKVALLADLHIGIKKGDQTFFDSQYRFFKEQLVPELNTSNVKDIWILGDVFDTRPTITIQTINRVIDLFKNVLKDFNIRIIVGNHDMFYNTDLGVNSLKILSLLPNVTVYEDAVTETIDGRTIRFQPWITDYTSDIFGNNKYDYAFMHADIMTFDVGGGRPSDVGLTAAYVLDHANTVYTGHYHTKVTRKYEQGKSISYLGAPYQLTRIDRDGQRGYHLLDIRTGEIEFIENRVSIKFTKHTYPDADLNMIANNVVDLDIPPEYFDQTKKVELYVQKLEKLKPAYPVNINYLTAESEDDDIDTGDLNIVTLFNNYLEQYNTTVDKAKIYDGFMDLYTTYKEQA